MFRPAAALWPTAFRKRKYEESANKAKAVIHAIEAASEVND